MTAIKINKISCKSNQPFWQRNYYERVVRNERELNALREYIQYNPQNWQKDSEYIETL